MPDYPIDDPGFFPLPPDLRGAGQRQVVTGGPQWDMTAGIDFNTLFGLADLARGEAPQMPIIIDDPGRPPFGSPIPRVAPTLPPGIFPGEGGGRRRSLGPGTPDGPYQPYGSSRRLDFIASALADVLARRNRRRPAY